MVIFCVDSYILCISNSEVWSYLFCVVTLFLVSSISLLLTVSFSMQNLIFCLFTFEFCFVCVKNGTFIYKKCAHSYAFKYRPVLSNVEWLRMIRVISISFKHWKPCPRIQVHNKMRSVEMGSCIPKVDHINGCPCQIEYLYENCSLPERDFTRFHGTCTAPGIKYLQLHAGTLLLTTCYVRG